MASQTRGVRQIDLSGHTDDLPSLPCLAYPAAGVDAFLPVDVEAGGMFGAGLYVDDGGDGQIAIVEDCGVPESCLAGRDVGFVGQTELLKWQNTSATAARVYVVVDLQGRGPGWGEGRLVIGAP